MPGSASAGLDFEPRQGVVVLPAGISSITLGVPIVTDRLAEGVETFELLLLPASGANLVKPRAIATLLDDDIPVINARDITVLEGSDSEHLVKVPLSLSIPSAIPVSVLFRVAPDTAHAPSDFALTNGMVSFPAGSQHEEFAFVLRGDNVAEFDETLQVHLFQPVNASVGTSVSQVIILDDDPTPNLTVTGTSIREPTGSNGFIEFHLRLSGPSTQPVRISYSTRNGTASAGVDYLSRLGNLVIPPGETEAILSVTVLGDALAEPDETLSLILRNPINATLDQAEATVQILDDDRPLSIAVSGTSAIEGSAANSGTLTFEVLLSAPATNTVAVNYATRPLTATPGTDFLTTTGILTFVAIGPGAGNTRHFVHVPILGDDTPEPNERLELELSHPVHAVLQQSTATGEILNDDGAYLTIDDAVVDEGSSGTTTLSFAVHRQGPTQDLTTVAYRTAPLTASSNTDFVTRSGLVTFLPGETLATVPVVVQADSLDEPDETFRLELYDPVGATLRRATATGTIVDDDLPSFQVDPVLITEGNTTPSYARFTVRLDTVASQEASVDYRVESRTATVGEDFLPLSGTLTFPPGIRDRQVAVPILADTADENDESLALVLFNPRFASISSPEILATILDDDPAPFVSIEDIEVRECSGDGISATADFPVRLSAASGRSIVVPFQTRPVTALSGEDFQNLTDTVVFPPGITRTTLRIPLTCDLDDERDEVFEVLLGAPTNAVLSRARARGRILDDDPPTLTLAEFPITEGGPEARFAEFSVTLSSPSTEIVALDFQTLPGTAGEGSDFLSVSNTLVLLPGSVSGFLRVPIVGDNVGEDTESFHIALLNPRGVRLERSTVEITILDDDPPLIRAEDARVAEGDSGIREIEIPIRLSRASSTAISLRVRTLPGSATAGDDFLSLDHVVLFEPGVTTSRLRIPIIGDTRIEGPETLEIALSTSDAASIEKTPILVTIVDDEEQPVLSLEDLEFPESGMGQPPPEIPITLSAASSLPVSVRVRTLAGSAVPESDYQAIDTTITFPPGVTVQTLPFSVIDDELSETTESLLLELSSPTNAAIARSTARVRILDDDLPRVAVPQATFLVSRSESSRITIPVTLTQPSPERVQVEFATVPETAVSPDDFEPASGVLVFQPGDTRQTIEIRVSPNAASESDETFTIRLGPATHASLPSSPTRITLISEPLPNRPPEITLGVPENANGATVGQTILLVASVSDPDNDITSVSFHSDETLIGQPAALPYIQPWIPNEPGIYSLTAQANDATGLASTSAPVSVQILAPARILVSDARVGESVGFARIPLLLSRTTLEPVAVRFATRDQTAVAPFDYLSTAARVVFQPGETNQILEIPVVQDLTLEPEESFLLELGSPENALVEISRASIFVTDDDERPATNAPPTIRLVSPTHQTILPLSSPVILEAEALDPEGSLSGVEFFLDDRSLGIDNAPPFRVEVPSVAYGDHTLYARAYDAQGAFADTPRVRITGADACGRAAIVANALDPEVDVVRDYLFEWGIDAAIFDRTSARLDTLSAFDLIVWHDGGQHGLGSEEVALFDALAASGKPLYLIGDRLVESTADLDVHSQAAWTRLIRLRPGPPALLASDVRILPSEPPPSVRSIVRGGPAGDVEDFVYPFDGAAGTRSEPEREIVLAQAGDRDVLVALPEDDANRTPRRIAQAFRVVTGADAASRTQRKRLFLNAVTWLLRCPNCANVNVAPLASIEAAPAPETGALLLSLRLHTSGACEALGVHVGCHLPTNLRLIRVETSRGTWEPSPDGNIIFFNLGRLQTGADESLRIVARPVGSGTATARFVVNSLNESAGALDDNEIEVSSRLDGIPNLTIRPRAPGWLELVVDGPRGTALTIESSASSAGPWMETSTVILSEEQPQGLVPIEIAISPRFFRVRYL